MTNTAACIQYRPQHRIAGLFAAVLVALMAASTVTGATTTAPFEPAEGCYLGAYIELDRACRGDVQAFTTLTGKPHATYFRYVGYGQPFPFRWVRSLKSHNIAPHIAWEPNDGLGRVADDEYLRGWAQAARHAGVPIFLRYASEMNGTWQSYSGDSEKYIEKWRTVYRVMDSVAPNVVMVWCPFATPRSTISDYYPGDEYVDWVGVNIYSVVHQDGDITKPATEDPVALLQYVYDRYAERKPIAVCEYGATHYCRAAGEDVTDFALNKMTRMYESLVDRFPRVRMINWFSVDAIGDDLADNNYSVTANDTILQRYKELIAKPHFLSEVVDFSGSADEIGTQIARQSEPEPASGQPAGVSAEPAPVETSEPLAAASLNDAADDRITIAVLGAPPDRITGTVEIAVEVPWKLNGGNVAILIDGSFRSITNVQPFRYVWDTEKWDSGEHTITAEVTDRYNRVRDRLTVSAIVIKDSAD